MERLNNAPQPQADRSSWWWKQCSYFLLLSQEFIQGINVSRDMWAPHPPHHRMSCSSSHSPGVRDLSAETPQPCPPSPSGHALVPGLPDAMLCGAKSEASDRKSNTPLQLAQDKKVLNLYIKYNETFRLHISDHTMLTGQKLLQLQP